MFGDINLKAEIVNGRCPTCTHETLLVSLTPEFFRLFFKMSRKNNFTSSCFRFCKDCILPSSLIHISWLFFMFAAMNFSQCSLLDISGPLLTKLFSIFFAYNKNINAAFSFSSFTDEFLKTAH